MYRPSAFWPLHSSCELPRTIGTRMWDQWDKRLEQHPRLALVWCPLLLQVPPATFNHIYLWDLLQNSWKNYMKNLLVKVGAP